MLLLFDYQILNHKPSFGKSVMLVLRRRTENQACKGSSLCKKVCWMEEQVAVLPI